mgnify:CR=1 FL=1
MLAVKELLLAWAQLIVGIDLVLVSRVAFEDHEFLVVEDEVGAFVETREHLDRFFEFFGVALGAGITFCCALAKLDVAEGFDGKSISHSGYRTSGFAVDEAVVDLGVDANHKSEFWISTGDVFGSVGEGVSSAEFFEANEIGMFRSQLKEEVSLGFVAVVRAVINDGWEVCASGEDSGEVIALSSGRKAA